MIGYTCINRFYSRYYDFLERGIKVRWFGIGRMLFIVKEEDYLRLTKLAA